MPNLEAALSTSRLARYPGSTLDEQLQVYRWNIALCEALYPTTHFFEVTLRNRMHAALSAHAGTEWWFQDPTLVYHPYAVRAVADAINNVRNRPAVPGDVVAGVAFGFWRGFHLKVYESLWRAILHDVYPSIPSTHAKRTVLNTRAESFRLLRNRVAHHEPVFHWSNLSQQHSTIHETLSWLSPMAKAELDKVDRFAAVMAVDPRT